MKHFPPGTDWRERVMPGEHERHAGYAKVLADIQAQRSLRHGPGRALHRRQVAAAVGTLEVLDGLPPFAAHGLFEDPRTYEVSVRLSNGSFDPTSARVPDVRGFAIRVQGVQGESALGGGPASCQVFTLINHETFGFAGSADFMEVVAAAARGRGEMLKDLLRAHGVIGGARRIARLLRRVGRPFSGFATETMYSAVPIACGPYAVRLRLVPSASNGKPQAQARLDWRADFAERLAQAPLHWDLQLQYFSDEQVTPIEDASVSWPTPYSTVARLMLPPQELDSSAGRVLDAEVEQAAFDPWLALAQHRPLGEVQRARKVAYLVSQQGRRAG